MPVLSSAIVPIKMSEIDGPETPSKRRLIAAGEQTLGQRGFDGTALQDIALAAGNANKYAVQYHFGDKEGLIAAILALRLRWIDRRRSELLERARELDLLGDIPALLEVLYLPVIEQVDDQGRNSFARFRLQYYARPDYNRFADDLPGSGGPAAARASDHLVAILDVDPGETRERLHLHSFLLLGALIDRDNRIANGQPAPTLDTLLVKVTKLTVGALRG